MDREAELLGCLLFAQSVMEVMREDSGEWVKNAYVPNRKHHALLYRGLTPAEMRDLQLYRSHTPDRRAVRRLLRLKKNQPVQLFMRFARNAIVHTAATPEVPTVHKMKLVVNLVERSSSVSEEAASPGFHLEGIRALEHQPTPDQWTQIKAFAGGRDLQDLVREGLFFVETIASAYTRGMVVARP